MKYNYNNCYSLDSRHEIQLYYTLLYCTAVKHVLLSVYTAVIAQWIAVFI